MKEINDSIKEVIKERLSNPIYGTFLVSWLILHWEFVYTLFFLDQEIIWNSTLLLKNDYLIKEFFNFYDWYFYFSWIFSFVLTYLVIWEFPRWFLIASYEEDLKYKTIKSIVKLREARKVKEEEAKLEEENAKELKALAQQEQSKKIIEDTDPVIKWEKEYQALKNKNIFSYFRTLYKIVYENQGGIYGEQSYNLAMPLIAYLDSTGALKLNRGQVELTEKGNFLMKRYLEEIS